VVQEEEAMLLRRLRCPDALVVFADKLPVLLLLLLLLLLLMLPFPAGDAGRASPMPERRLEGMAILYLDGWR